MEILYIVTFFVALLSSVLSGIAGVGGGFIMAPYWLLIGLSPAQSVATGSFMALGMGISSLAAFRNTGHFPVNTKMTVVLCSITAVAAIIGAFTLPHIDADRFSIMIAVITVASLPLLFVDRKNIHANSRHRAFGIVLFTIFTLAGSIVFSSAFSVLIALTLSTFFGLTVLQSTALRRLLGMVQVFILFIILVAAGGFVWPHAISGISGGVIGSYVGTKIAIKKGETFAKYALIVGATISSVALII